MGLSFGGAGLPERFAALGWTAEAPVPTRPDKTDGGIASGIVTAGLLWLQVFCQLFAVPLLLIHGEFS
jgi:hypothetical protein